MFCTFRISIIPRLPENTKSLLSEFKPSKQEAKSRTKAAPILLTADLDLPDIDTPIPDLNDLDLDKNRARLEEITLREENDFLNVDDLEITGDQVGLQSRLVANTPPRHTIRS